MFHSKVKEKTGIIIATGPSLSKEQLKTAKQLQKKGFMVFGMNHVWKDYPDLDVFMACNPVYYDTQWENGLKDIKAEKWTWDQPTATRYNINYIEGKWADGFSTDPGVIHYGHSSGFQLPGLAYHYGVRRMLLIGYDMGYAKDYDAKNKNPGSTPRHYFGEYEDSQLHHWPVSLNNGVFDALIKQFEKVKEINGDLEIVNCTPGSAMKCFPFGSLNDFNIM